MKKLIVILVLTVIFTGIDINAQRTVVVKRNPNHTTVVKRTPRGRVVYVHNRRAVRTARVLPPKAVIIHHRNFKYYYHEGVYYKLYKGRYIIVPPPRGLRIRVLPPHHTRIVIGPRVIFYAGGVFYQEQDGQTDEYEVIEPPVGTIIYNLPEDAEEVTVDGNPYYEYDGVLYQQVSTDEDKSYEVACLLNDE